MEILDFYSKILPAELFNKKKEIVSTSIENAYKHIVNQNINTTKVSDDSWMKRFQKPTYSRVNHSEEFQKYTPLSQLDDFTYNVVKNKDDFKHNNFFSDTSGYTIINDERIPLPVFNKNQITENFIGLDNPIDRIPRKREVLNMFLPSERITQNNSYIDTGKYYERMNTTERHNDKILAEPQRVGPGIGRSAGDNTQRGLHSLFRILPKNVDQLRVTTNPKQSFENEYVPGQRGTNAPLIGNVQRKYEDTFMINRPVVRSRSQTTKTKQEGAYNIDPTERDMNKKEYTGPAYASHTHSGLDSRLKIINEEPKTNEYRTPDQFLITGPKQQQVTDPQAYSLTTNQRHTYSDHNPVLGAKDTNKGGVAVNYFEIPNVTLKDTNVTNVRQGFINGSMRSGTAFNPKDIPRHTIKQTTVDNKYLSGSTSQVKGSQVYNLDDIPKQTIKQTVLEAFGLLGTSIHSTKNESYMIDTKDTPKDTLRQSTLYNPNLLGSTIHSISNGNYTMNPNDKPKDTVRQTTMLNPDQLGTSMHSISNGNYTVNPNDKPRDTVRQTTMLNPDQLGTSMHSISNGNYTIDPNDKPRDTVRQTTMLNPDQLGTSLHSISNGNYTIDPNDKPRDTVRQTTMLNPDQLGTSLHSISNGNYTIDPNDKPRDTLRQTTMLNPDQLGTSLHSISNGNYTIDPNDKPRNTIRQTTMLNPDQLGTSLHSISNGNYTIDPNDKPRDTIKQTTIERNLEGVSISSGLQPIVSVNMNDKPRNTIKETTVNNTQILGTTQNSKAQYVLPEDLPKYTHRISQVGIANSKELGLNISHDQGMGYISNRQEAKETIKETTLLKDYSGQAQYGDGKGYISNPHEAKETQRQTMSINNHVNEGPAASKNKKDYVFEKDNVVNLGCRNELWGKNEKWLPTEVSLATIPQINTQGSLHLRSSHVDVDNRDIYPNSTTNYYSNNVTINNTTRETIRNQNLLFRLGEDSDYNEQILHQNPLSININPVKK